MLGIFKYGIKLRGKVKILRTKDNELIIIPADQSNYLTATELPQQSVAAYHKHNKKGKNVKCS